MIIAQSVFNSLSHMWADHRLPTTMKLRLYTSAVCSSFTHGCEAWKITDSVHRTINGFNSRCLSIITGKEFNVTASNPDFNLIEAISKRRLRFAGHILRMNPNRLLRRTFMTYMNSRPRPRGSLLHNCDEISIEQITRKGWNQFINSMYP